MTILHQIKKEVKQKNYLQYLWDKSKSIMRVIPYYLVQEGLSGDRDLNLKPRLSGCVVRFLRASDMKTISENPEVEDSEDILLERLANGCLCLGLIAKGQILSYVWCNLRECDSIFLSFPLKGDQAFLFNARTFRAYRGKDLAPYLRCELYKNLEKIRRNKCLSIIELFNLAAMNVEEKLKAKPLKLYLNILFFKRYRCNLLLKNYRKENP